MPTVREQISDLIRQNADGDYWEKLVLRYAEVLLAEVDENLRGIPIQEAGIEMWNEEDYFNLPDTIELVHGLPSPKRWNIAIEGRRRLGFTDSSEEFTLMAEKTLEEVKAEYAKRRAELRARPFVPSPIPFPSGTEED
jgi:hypothetical protein